MDVATVFEANRRALHEAQEKGLANIDTKALQSIFDQIESQVLESLENDTGAQPTALELEKFRSDLVASLSYQDHRNNWSLEGFKQIIALGQSTLKSIMLINGGASVALLAFLGNLVSNPGSKVSILPFANSLGAFVIGVFLSAVAYALTYFSQLFYDGEEKWQQKLGLGLHIATSIVGAAALVAFLCGAHSAYWGFVEFGA